MNKKKAPREKTVAKTKTDAKNCWDYWDCQIKEQCIAYTTDSGIECWLVAGHIASKLKKCPRVMYKIDTCFECPWFQKLNPDIVHKNKIKK